MKYDFSKEYQIKIEGSTEEIKDWIKEISGFIGGPNEYNTLLNEFGELENIVGTKIVTLGSSQYHRIYFNKKSLLYLPNVNGDEAKEFHFNMFKKLFDESKKKMDEKYKK